MKKRYTKLLGLEVDRCCYYCIHNLHTFASGTRYCDKDYSVEECGPDNNMLKFEGTRAYINAKPEYKKD